MSKRARFAGAGGVALVAVVVVHPAMMPTAEAAVMAPTIALFMPIAPVSLSIDPLPWPTLTAFRPREGAVPCPGGLPEVARAIQLLFPLTSVCQEALGTGTADSSPGGWPCRVVDLLERLPIPS